MQCAINHPSAYQRRDERWIAARRLSAPHDGVGYNGVVEAPAIRLRSDSLVVLAGPSASGKSTWASRWFRPGQIVSSDELRGIVGEHEHDLRASEDAFAVLDDIVRRRLGRGLLTVIDTLGMDQDRHQTWIDLAKEHGRPTHLVRFDIDAATCRRRNEARANAVPAKVLSSQLTKWAELAAALGAGYDQQHEPGPARVVPGSMLSESSTGNRQLTFGLLVSTFDWPDDQPVAERLGEIAVEAEHAGFESIWVMDHFMQIPQVGREWDPMLEAYTTLAYLAAKTTRVGLGALVSCVTHRNIAHLGKIIATLDVVSQGRARCGLGLGWFEREHRAYGYEFPSTSQRYAMLEDALEFLPLLWGAGAPPFQGRTFSTPEAIGYPRPLQDKIPILVGGSGEKRTLALAAKYADACNLFGEPDVLDHKVRVLHDHCARFERDPAEIQVTQLSNVLVAADHTDLSNRIGELNHGLSKEQFIERTKAATAAEHVDRFAQIADAGVDQIIVSLADIGLAGATSNFASVIDHFRA